jgi:hypothetical protein
MYARVPQEPGRSRTLHPTLKCCGSGAARKK